MENGSGGIKEADETKVKEREIKRERERETMIIIVKRLEDTRILFDKFFLFRCLYNYKKKEKKYTASK